MTTKLHCYALTTEAPPVIPADPSRKWMDDFASRHPYRCLPIAVANTYGWQILSPYEFSIDWTGAPEVDAISFKSLDGYPYLNHFVQSNFSRGIVTFHTGYLFQTDPGWDLMATGPLNRPKHGITPLSGVIETDWLPYPFTMNWQLTAPGTIKFAKDEPFCTVFPVKRETLDNIVPEIYDLNENDALKKQYEAWLNEREQFMEKFKGGDEETLKQAWQKYYFKGEIPGQEEGASEHRQKVRLSKPIDNRKSKNVGPFD